MTKESTLEGSSVGETTQIENCLDPLHFPPKNSNEDSQQQISFVQACQLAADNHRPLHLSQDIVDLTETIVLRKRQRLVIVGISKHDLSSKTIRISGNVHSLFLGNNHSQLELVDLELMHQEPDGEDCTSVGAAVNLRYKASAKLHNCAIVSQAGFCCWAVQKASLFLENCNLQAPLRSAVVCFGKANFEGRFVKITNVGVHGVCARGECNILLKQSQLVDAAVRGLYAYANASVCLEECTVSGTVRPDVAAIEVLSAAVDNEQQAGGSKPNKKGSEERKASSLIMKKCEILNNGGVGVRIRGGVKHNLHSETSNHFMGNVGGDEVDFLSAQQENEGDETSNTFNQQTEHLRRDDSGSSFRKGDWWCLNCTPKSIVHNSKDSCPRCGSEKNTGKPLSSEEVVTLNRGESIATTNTTAPTWWFDGDDAGWLLYDTESTEALESVFQSLNISEANHEEQQLSSKTVFLSNGRYSVNLEAMEQINTESHMLRLVQRRIN